MSDILLDTDILIDLLKNYPPAFNWMATIRHLSIGITAVNWLEVMQGANSKLEQRSALRFLTQFEIHHLHSDDSTWTIQQFPTAYLVHGVGMLDVFTGAIAVRLQLPIYTRNVKHFSRLPGVLAITPY